MMKIAHIHVWDEKNKGDVAIVMAVQELLLKQFGKAEIFNFPVEILKQYDELVIQKVNSCDLVVIGGGGILYWYFLPFDHDVFEAIVPPVAIFGVGYIQEIGHPPLSLIQNASIKALCDRANLIAVRDWFSANYLKELGVMKLVEVIGDPVIVLSEEPNRSLVLGAHPRLAFNINYSGWLGFGQNEAMILESYRKLVMHFFKQNGSAYYALHHPDEHKILQKLSISGITVIDLPPREQKWAYGQFDIMVGMMLHSCVMAFGAGIPEINVGYDIRNQSFAEFIEAPELIIPADQLNPDLLLSRADDVLNRQVEYCKSFKVKRTQINRAQLAFLTKLATLVPEMTS